MRGPDGKMSVRGLQANQKLVQTSDGKYLILPSNHTGKSTRYSLLFALQPFSLLVVGGKVVPQGLRPIVPTSGASSSPAGQPPKVLIRSVQPKTILSANNVVKIGTESKVSLSSRVAFRAASQLFYSQESPTSTVQSTSSLPVQKIITSTGQVITQQVQGNIISSANLQQLLQRGNVTPGQKIVVQSGPGGVQKLLVASPSQQQVQQTGEKRIIIQNASGQQQQYILQNQNNASPAQQQFVTIGGQKLILQTSGTPTQVQQIKTVTSPIQQQQQIQFQIQESSPQPQQQQIVVQSNGNNLAQQLAQGKIQVMNLNGQQVLVKSVGNNQSVIVGQVKTSTSQVTPVKQTMQSTIVTSPPSQQIVKTVQIPSLVSSGESSVSEQAMLAGHPPGTVVKCVTAQVMQTPSGPRIVLQGLQGSDISPQQSQVLQQQVKQQLMKGK